MDVHIVNSDTVIEKAKAYDHQPQVRKRACHNQGFILFILCSFMKYYTIIDFNEVDIRIYLPEEVIFTEAARPR